MRKWVEMTHDGRERERDDSCVDRRQVYTILFVGEGGGRSNMWENRHASGDLFFCGEGEGEGGVRVFESARDRDRDRDVRVDEEVHRVQYISRYNIILFFIDRHKV